MLGQNFLKLCISFIFTIPSSFHSFFRRKKQFPEMHFAVRWINLLQINHQCEVCWLLILLISSYESHFTGQFFLQMKFLSQKVEVADFQTKKIIVKLEKRCAYCSHFKEVEPGVFASWFAWIMCLRGFVFHGINCSSNFQFWKIFLLDLTWVGFVLQGSKLLPLEPYVGLISLHALEKFPSG